MSSYYLHMSRWWSSVKAAFGVGSAPVPDVAPTRFGVPMLPVDQLLTHMYQRVGTVDRAKALRVPAVLKGRNMICSISTLPLEAVNAQNVRQDRPLFRQLDPNVPNVVVMAQTVEDLVFEGIAWWRITGFDPEDGMPSQIERYDVGQVSLQPPADYERGYLPSGRATEGVIWMAGKEVPFDEVIRFDSPNPALLDAGQDAIRRALAANNAADLYARYPRRRGYFRPTDGIDPADDITIEKILDDWAAASQDHVDGYVPAALEYTAIQDSTPAELQLIQMMTRATLDVANCLGVDPEDLGVNTTSRVYQNATDRRQDKINEALAPYMRAITDRLSMPDVTAEGTRVRLSLADYLKADPKTRAEVQAIYHGMGATDVAEIREDESRPPRVIRPSVPRETSPVVSRETSASRRPQSEGVPA